MAAITNVSRNSIGRRGVQRIQHQNKTHILVEAEKRLKNQSRKLEFLGML